MSVSDPTPERPLFDWYIQNYHRSNSDSTRTKARTVGKLFKRFTSEKGLNPESVDEEVAFEFIEMLVEKYSADYQHQAVGEVSRFYSYCLNKGVEGFEGNPFESVLLDHDPLDEIRGRDPHMLTVDQMSDYFASLDNPRFCTPALTMAKTTRRVGEVINLDLADVNLAHPACNWDVHQKIRHRDDYIYFGPEAEKGEEYRGEVRHCSSKTKCCRVVPVDNELKQALLWYLAIRPGTADPYSPLFKAAQHSSKRLNKEYLTDKIKEHSKNLGYYYGPNDEDNVVSHYFRHWATTRLRERTTGDTGLVDYIRGDTGSDMKDQYTHWSEEKERAYLDIVPKFFD